MSENIKPLDRINMIKTMLDKIVDSKGREMCNYVCVTDEFLDRLRDDILIMEEKINDFEEIQNGVEN